MQGKKLSYVRCALCGEDDADMLCTVPDYISGEQFTVVKCRACELVYTNPRVPEDEIARFYPQQYYGKNNVRFRGFVEYFMHLFRAQRAREVEKYKRPGRILDIGCGRGRFLAEMRKKGWDVVGTELSDEAHTFAKKELELHILDEDVRDCGFEDESFDVVTLFHVLEHLPNPSETLAEIFRILKENGLLVIAVPNIDSFQAKISKDKWFHLDIPRHYYHFSVTTLSKMLERNNFKVIKQNHFSLEYNPFGLTQSLLNMVKGDFNFLYDLLRNETSKFYKMNRTRYARNLAITSLLGPIIGLASLAIEFMVPFFNLGGTVTLYATKQTMKGDWL